MSSLMWSQRPERLYKNTSALSIVLFSSAIGLYLRGALFLLDRYEFATPEFQVISRTQFGIFWILVAAFISYSLYTTSLTAWRFALLAQAILYGYWGQLLITTRGFDALNGIITYFVMSMMFFSIAVRANDPRPYQMLKKQIHEPTLGGST